MSVGKINDLVSDDVLSQLDVLYTKLGLADQRVIDLTASANKFNNEIGNVKTLTDFTTATQAAIQAMQGVSTANQSVIDTQKQITVQTQAASDAVKVKLALDANATAVLQQVSGTLDANIKLLIQQKLELKNVNDQLKDLNKQYAGSQQSQNALSAKTQQLTQQQITLKEAIAAQNLVIRQQVKENNAAETSNDAMLARLNLLRKAYNSLSEEERNNAQVGGVMLAQIKELATATSKINQEQGKYNDSVGRYEDAIKSAISSYVPFGNQIVKAVDTFNNLTKETNAAGAATAGLGTKFASFSIAEFAIAIAAATYYLQQFRNTGQDVEQFVGGLKNQFANLGKNVVDMFKTGSVVNPFKNFINSFNQGVDVTKAIQQVKNFNEVNDQQIQILQAQADQYRARAKNVKSSEEERIAALQKAQKIESDIIKQQQSNANDNIEAGIALAQKGTKPLLPSRLAQLRGQGGGGFNEATQAANDLAQSGQITEAGYEALQAAYQRQTQAMNAANMKLIRQQNDESRIGLKAAKEINNDELELQKAKLTGEKDTAKLILDDNNQSYQARLAALKIFVSRSKEIIGTENTIANRAPGITGVKKQVNNQNAKNQNAQVDNFDLVEQQKIQKEVNDKNIAEQKKIYDTYKANEKAKEDLITNGYNDELIELDYTNSEKLLKINQAYADGLISEKNYRNQVKKLQKDSAAEAIDIEIEALKKIADAQASALALGYGNPKDLQSTANRITRLKTQSNNLKAGSLTTGTTGGFISQEGLESAKEALAFSDQAIKALDIVQGLIDTNAKAKIDALEKEFSLIQQNANAEKDRVNNSILSSKEKARQDNIIDAQTAQQRAAITLQENQVKTKAAEFDKAAAIAKIIQQTAVAVVTALTIPIYGEVLAGVIGALGAAQLAVALATPIPQFEKGGTVKKDGHIITGEAGPELRIDPSGKYSLTADHANITYAKTGTKIISNKELMTMMAKPEPIHYMSDSTNDNRRMEKLLAENNALLKKQKAPVVKVINNGAYASYSQQRNY